jgi:ABC-type dipeptide/oligopeptide/nickel transport system permease subunit
MSQPLVPKPVSSEPTSNNSADADMVLSEYGGMAGLRRDWRRFSRNRLAVVGLGFILFLFLIAFTADWVAPYHYETTNPPAALEASSLKHWFGTDELGRDMLSRVIYSARNAILVSFGSVMIGLAVGAFIGAVSGFYGGMLDIAVMRVVDIMFAFPQFLLLIILVTALGRGLGTMFIAIGITSWAGYARLVRGQILSAKNNDYVEAARCLGSGNGHIIRKYILPNIIGPIIVAISFGVPAGMLAESAMSLIGMGLRPPMPSWGNLISAGMMQMYGFPHLVLWPSLTFGFTLLAFTFVGDGLREIYGKE